MGEGEKGLNLDPQQVKQAETQKAAADAPLGAGCAGLPGEQKAQERRTAHYELRGHAAANGIGSDFALARQPCGHQAACRSHGQVLWKKKEIPHENSGT